MSTTVTLFPGRYVQGDGALSRLGRELARFGRRGLAILAPSAAGNLGRELAAAADAVTLARAAFGRECSEPEIERLLVQARQAGSDFIVSLGGGKTIDTGKVVADRLGLPVAVVPTIASTDAPCSACAVIYDERGEVASIAYQRRNPDLVLVDTGVIARAPARFLVAGMGDALATWFEAASCQQSGANNEAGGQGSRTALTLARLCYDTLLAQGVAARRACEAGTVTPALEAIVEANTLLSGLGFESGGLAAAHAIHNGLTVLPETHAAYHGEKVALGVLASLFLTEQSRQTLDEVYGFCEAIGLPTTLAGIGLGDAAPDALLRVAERACAAGESIHHEPVPVSPARVIEALRAADAEGRSRKARAF